MHDHAAKAARYWASRPGNQSLAAVFDVDDARQEAALALLLDPAAKPLALYRRVLDAVNDLFQGYRQRNLPTMVSFDDVGDLAVECQAERYTLLRERLDILFALPEDKRRMAWHWVDGETDTEAGARYGVKRAAWALRRLTLFRQLQQRGL